MEYNYEVIDERYNKIFHIKSKNVISIDHIIEHNSKIYKVKKIEHIAQKNTDTYITNIYVKEEPRSVIILEDK